MKLLLDQIKIVLVETSHPGNIGATARAMKNMGLGNLVLVDPKHFPDYEAERRASGANDLLETCQVVSTLKDAIKDCHWVVASSARNRQFKVKQLDLKTAATKIIENIQSNCKVAVLFGTERTGLSNEQLEKAHAFLTIPCDRDYNSLNVASAVQLVTYECRMQAIEKTIKFEVLDEPQLASLEDIDGLMSHLKETLIEIGYLDSKKPKKLIRRLQRFYLKARPTAEEVNIWRGIFTKVLKNK